MPELKRFAHATPGVSILTLSDIETKVHLVLLAQVDPRSRPNARQQIIVVELSDAGGYFADSCNTANPNLFGK